MTNSQEGLYSRCTSVSFLDQSRTFTLGQSRKVEKEEEEEEEEEEEVKKKKKKIDSAKRKKLLLKSTWKSSKLGELSEGNESWRRVGGASSAVLKAKGPKGADAREEKAGTVRSRPWDCWK